MDNVVVFKFGTSLNLMFQIINGIVRKKLNKKVLILNSNLNIKANEKDNFEVVLYDKKSFDKIDFNNYSLIIVESDFDKDLLKIISKEEYKDLMFLFTTISNKDIDDKTTYCDLENLDKLPMIQKMMKINEMRKKLTLNKKSKKFKFF